MRMGITIRFIVLALIVLSAFLILRSSSAKQQPACKESMDQCCKKKCKTPADNNLIWETFSRQFIIIGL
jgi:hypothetical protein